MGTHLPSLLVQQQSQMKYGKETNIYIGAKENQFGEEMLPMNTFRRHQRSKTWPEEPNLRSIGDSSRFSSTHELLTYLTDRLSSNYFRIQYHFMANDPNGKGCVSREAFLRILQTFCGSISKYQFASLLKRLKLEDRKAISFGMLLRSLELSQRAQLEWINPINNNNNLRESLPGKAERTESEYEINVDVQSGGTKPPFDHVTAGGALGMLRTKLKEGEPDLLKTLLPNACFLDGGLIIPPHLRELLLKLDIKLPAAEFYKLWRRFDIANAGALKPSNFYKVLGLEAPPSDRHGAVPLPGTKVLEPVIGELSELTKESGNADTRKIIPGLKKFHTTLGTPSLADDRKKKKAAKMETFDGRILTGKEGGTGPGRKHRRSASEPAYSKLLAGVARDRSRQKSEQQDFENVIDQVHYLLEKPYRRMKAAFVECDYSNNGYIMLADFRRVLQLFDLYIGALDVEEFLGRSGMLATHGQVNYVDFLQKYFNRGEQSIFQRVVASNSSRNYELSTLQINNASTLTPEELQQRLIHFLHGDFLFLRKTFQEADPNCSGFLQSEVIHKALGCLLRRPLGRVQSKMLNTHLQPSADGKVAYGRFLDTFNTKPGIWNQRRLHGVLVVNVHDGDSLNGNIPPEARQMRVERQEFERKLADKDFHKREKVTNMLRDILRHDFHTFDKGFRQLDRRNTGNISKDQLLELLRRLGHYITSSELSLLWDGVGVSESGIHSYNRFLATYRPLELDINAGDQKIDKMADHPEEKSTDISPKTETEMQRGIEGAKQTAADGRHDGAEFNTTPSAQFPAGVTVNTVPPDGARDGLLSARKDDAAFDSHKSAEGDTGDRINEDGDKVTSSGSGTGVRTQAAAAKIPHAVLANALSPSELLSPGRNDSSAAHTAAVDMKFTPLPDRIKKSIVSNWDSIKDELRELDPYGSGVVKRTQMKALMKRYNFDLTQQEMESICQEYDQHNDGRFHYMALLRQFATKRLSTAEKRLNSVEYKALKGRLQDQLMKDHRSLYREFKRRDSQPRTGELSIPEFMATLREFRVTFTPEELYDILTALDINLEGQVPYERFMASCLELNEA